MDGKKKRRALTIHHRSRAVFFNLFLVFTLMKGVKRMLVVNQNDKSTVALPKLEYRETGILEDPSYICCALE